MLYGYNLAGALTYEKYPSGREIFTSFDTAGRLDRLEGQRTSNNEARKDYASTFVYSPHGAVASMKLGNNYEHTTFNNRLQPIEIGLGTASNNSNILELDYTYGVRDGNGLLDTTKNNGNVESQQISVNGVIEVTQSYLYDSLNRLLSAEEMLTAAPHTPMWKQAYSYDRFGNRTFAAGTTLMEANIAFATNTTSNRIITAGYSYDNAGNVIQEPGGKSYAYDGEHHQMAFTLNNATTLYRYDGDGRRVKKENG
jgi:hypothetical protein